MNWKNRDTWNLHDGRPGGNNRSITSGGYKEYSDAMRDEYRRVEREFRSRRRTPEIEALNGEINYICGMYKPAFYGDEAVDAIAERYGLPCWGQRAGRERWIKRGYPLKPREWPTWPEDEARPPVRLRVDGPAEVSAAVRDTITVEMPTEWTGRGRPQISGGAGRWEGWEGLRIDGTPREAGGTFLLHWTRRPKGPAPIVIQWQPVAGQDWQPSDGKPVEHRQILVFDGEPWKPRPQRYRVRREPSRRTPLRRRSPRPKWRR